MQNPPLTSISLFLILLGFVNAPLSAETPPPNVVVIFADDLGYGDLSCYGATKLKTPNIDRLASEGRRFTDAHSASAVCTPSRYALITGRYPFRKGLSRPVFLRTGLVIDQERTTVADVMKNAGYATACIGKWHLGFGEKTPDWNGDLKPGPLELGFDYYYGVPVVNSHPPFVYVENYRVVGLVPDDPFVYGKKAKTQEIEEKMIRDIGGADAAHALYDDYAVGTHLAEKSVEWIENNKDAPFFLYLSTTNIHHPFTPAKRFQGTSECGLYGDFVHELDWIVGEVMATLEKNELDENTLVIFTSDNGGMINMTGQKAIQQGHQLNGKLLGFKFDAWEGGHRVPFIARWPGQIEAGSVSDQLISNIDLMATMAALTGQELKPEDGQDSFNALPALTEIPEKPIRNELVLAASSGAHLVLRQGDWVYIGAKGGGGFGSSKPGSHTFGGTPALKFAGQTNSDVVDGKLKKDAPPAQLYDLGSDLSQSENVIRENPEKAESLRVRLAEIKAGKGTRPGLPEAPPAPPVEEKKPAAARADRDIPGPNIVVIMADDLGYADLGCYGCKDIPTPHIDGLAENGVRFTSAYATGNMCGPSRAGFLTGRYQSTFGYYKNVSQPLDPAQGLPELDTIASLLKQQGYVTGGVGKWHMGTSDQQHPNAMGFDDWFGFLGGGLTYYPLDHPSYGGRFTPLKKPAGVRDMQHTLPVIHNRTPVKWDHYITHELTDAGIVFLERNHEKPFFLFMSYNAPHLELEAPEETTAKYPSATMTPIPGVKPADRSVYAAMVDEMDVGIGQILAKIDALGLSDNTVVWFLSDHGGMKRTSDNRPFKGAKGSSFEGGLRVPLIVKWPENLPKGAVLDHPVTSLDIGATSLAMAGGDPAKAGLHGKDIRPYLTGQSKEPPHDVLYWRTGTFAKKSGVIRNGEHKLMIQGAEPLLYNLKDDPGETRNLAKVNPKLVQTMLNQWKEWDKASQPDLWTTTKGDFQFADYDWLKGSQHYRVSENPVELASLRAPSSSVRSFRTIQLSDQFHAESAALADMDNDGHTDVVYGPFWFAGPDFEQRHQFYKPNPFGVGTYSNNFFSYVEDFDQDGWNDVLVLGFPGREAATYWFKNPGEGKDHGPWKKFEVFGGVENESPVWADVTGDGKREILCSIKGQFGFVAPKDWENPELPWTFTPIASPKSTGGKFTHGLGFGDVNGDGRNDLLEKTGWWEQPESGLWIKHSFSFSEDKGGSQMFAYDFDGDGDNDVVSAINAHGYGLAWFEQVPKEGGGITFKKHLLMGATPEESKYGIAFSQLHGVGLADMDGDGVMDFVTGKRYFAHGGKDPGGKDAPVLYWFRTVRGEAGSVDFVPYLIHEASGVGVDVTLGDVNGDGRIDVVTGNKKGCFVHLQSDQMVPAPRPMEVAPMVKPTKSVAPKIGVSKGYVIEGESLKILKKTGSLRPQPLRNRGTQKWSDDAQIWWREGKPGDVIEFAVPVSAAGNYRLSVAMTKARDYGIVEFALDGKPITEPIDLYEAGVVHTGNFTLVNEVMLTEGEHRLSVTMVGANPKAEKKYMFGLDYVALLPANADEMAALPVLTPPTQPTKPKIKEGNDLAAEALSPAEQQKKFRVPEGFVVELVASEETGLPKPTSIAFDDAGRLWATTAVEYPRDRDPEIWTKPGRDRVVVIDAPHLTEPQPVRTFANGMVMPMSVLPHENGAYIAQGPEILFLEDKDGDGQVDQRNVLLRGFGVQDTHTLPHQLARMPGGRITFSQGVLNNGTIVDADGDKHPFDKTLIAAMSFDGTGLDIIGAGMNNIWAWAHSRTGRVFIHEANDWGYSLVAFEEDSSYPSFRSTKIHPEAPIHPPTADGLNLGGTGFSGIAICDDRSGSFPAPYSGQLFVANPIYGKINAATATLGTGNVWKFEKQEDLVSCDDPMFRPVYVTFGPDGCLYIADWYNRIISHNEVQRDHPARDKEHGRIWRIRHVSQSARVIPDFSKMATTELVAALGSDNTWAMRAAWHQIASRQEPSVIPALKGILGDQSKAVDARIHALWSLEELAHFDPELWKQLLADPDADLRREAVRALSSLSIPQFEVAPLLRALADETEWTVRYEILRYFRRAEGAIDPVDLALLRNWRAEPAPTTNVKGPKGSYLALDGSYQRAFQDFLLKLAETKTQLPVMIESKWNRVLAKNPNPADPKAMGDRIASVKALLPGADLEMGKTLTKSICLTCHAIGNEGVGFAPPLNGSASRDLDGLLTAIIDPNAAMENVFRSFRIVTKDGQTFEGFNQNEDRDFITLLLMGGAKQLVPIKDIQTAGYIEGLSVMPDITGGMTAQQVADITAYLRTVN